MIESGTGNLLLADVEALVNTVNTVGVMGKGIALQFKKAFPDNFEAYQAACRTGEVVPGRVFVYDRSASARPRYILNFPTKRHWRSQSRLGDIREGLVSLREAVQRLKIASIAVPPLGCGLGGLDWDEVRPLIVRAFESIPEVRVLIFEPASPPDPHTMPDHTSEPAMTPGRAAALAGFGRYASAGYRLTLLEVQKILYFLQEAGEPLQLRFAKGPYGPYADAVRHVVSRMDGHFLRGWGDANNRPETALDLVPAAVEAAERYLGASAATQTRLQRVADLIDGFETPYGMELLSSLHWVSTRDVPAARTDAALAAAAVGDWNDRKKRLFRPEHLVLGWERLQSRGWLASRD